MQPDYFLIVDTETTQDQLVADFGAVVINRKGEIMAQCAVLIFGIYNDEKNHPLFHIFGDSGDLWSKAGLPKRYSHYNDMLNSGERSLAGVAAINKWLAGVFAKYNPYLTAYNLAFDLDKCLKTGIDLSMYKKQQFCLWYAAAEKWAHTKQYRNFAMNLHAFNAPTQFQNMSYKTNAEIMARFVLDNPALPDEPHTALEDVVDYEAPILIELVRTTKKKTWLKPKAYSWRDYQVNNHFTAK